MAISSKTAVTAFFITVAILCNAFSLGAQAAPATAVDQAPKQKAKAGRRTENNDAEKPDQKAPTQSACNTKPEPNLSAESGNAIRETDGGAAPSPIKLGKLVVVEVPAEKYDKYFIKQKDEVAPTPVLYINDIAINGLKSVSAGCNKVAFIFTRTDESEDIWGRVLAKANGDDVLVGIGTVQKGFVFSETSKRKLELVHEGRLYAWASGMVLFIVATFVLGIRSPMLRDLPRKIKDASAPSGEATSTVEPMKRPYSLARWQMAVWFLLTVGAFSYIWLVTGDLGNLPASILALIGLSGGTTVLGAVVDANAPASRTQEHDTFLKDILSDDDGVTEKGVISFHRYQMFIWTIVLAVIFIARVKQTASMPDFSAELLGLMGISSGTYLGFKIPAVQAAKQAPSKPESKAPAQPDPDAHKARHA